MNLMPVPSFLTTSRSVRAPSAATSLTLDYPLDSSWIYLDDDRPWLLPDQDAMGYFPRRLPGQECFPSGGLRHLAFFARESAALPGNE